MKTADRITLGLALAHAGLSHAAAPLADSAYQPPTRDWLTGEFYAWYRSCLFQLGCTGYKAENWDCDDFADLFAAFARICHRRTSPNAGAALPVGILWYVAAGRGGHAVNVALTSDHGLVVIEPQSGNLLTLTPEEAASAWLLKL